MLTLKTHLAKSDHSIDIFLLVGYLIETSNCLSSISNTKKYKWFKAQLCVNFVDIYKPWLFVSKIIKE